MCRGAIPIVLILTGNGQRQDISAFPKVGAAGVIARVGFFVEEVKSQTSGVQRGITLVLGSTVTVKYADCVLELV